jgi:hypothetical protein
MPKASAHQSSSLARALYIGNSGAGKTGSLVSLVKAGYKLRIIDMDQGVGILFNYVREQCPELLDTIEYQSFRNKTKMTPTGPQLSGPPVAFTAAVKAMDKWEDGTNPAEWGPDHILVLDSLTTFGREAYNWAKAMNPGTKEKRQWYQGAQEVVESTIANLTSDSFQTNVLVLTHVDIRDNEQLGLKAFASSIGQALGPKLPRYFNTVIAAESIGSGKNVRRKIKTNSTPLLDLKTEAPMRVEAEYDLGTGMAELFAQLKNG